ncbi:MAG: hypothetical protein ACOYJC_01870 [Christensenellales bacterium]|jgi:hypothetical protein
MSLRKRVRLKMFGVVLIGLGVFIMLIMLPFWMWAMIAGALLILCGLILFKDNRC